MLGLVRARLGSYVVRRCPRAIQSPFSPQRRVYSTTQPTQSGSAKGGFLKGASKAFLLTSSLSLGVTLLYAHNPTVATRVDQTLPADVAQWLQITTTAIKNYIHDGLFAPKLELEEVSKPPVESPPVLMDQKETPVEENMLQQANELDVTQVNSTEQATAGELKLPTIVEDGPVSEQVIQTEPVVMISSGADAEVFPTLQQVTADDDLRDSDELSMVGNLLGEEIIVGDQSVEDLISEQEEKKQTEDTNQDSRPQVDDLSNEQEAESTIRDSDEVQDNPEADQTPVVIMKSEDLQLHVQKLVEERLEEVAKEIEQQYIEQLRQQHILAQEAQQQRDLKWKSFVIDKLQRQEDQLNRLWETRLEHEIQLVRDRFSAEFDDRRTKVQAIEERVLQLGQLFQKRISFAQDMTRIHALWVALFSLRHALHEEQATPFRHELQILESVSESSKEDDPVVKAALESLLPLSAGVASVSALQSQYKEMRNDVFRYAIHPDTEDHNPAAIVFGTGGVLAHFASYIAASLLIKPNFEDVAATITNEIPVDVHPHQRLARAEYFLLYAGDLHRAVQEFEMMPRLARERMGPWLKEAQKRLIADQGYVFLQAYISSLALSLL